MSVCGLLQDTRQHVVLLRVRVINLSVVVFCISKAGDVNMPQVLTVTSLKKLNSMLRVCSTLLRVSKSFLELLTPCLAVLGNGPKECNGLQFWGWWCMCVLARVYLPVRFFLLITKCYAFGLVAF